MRVLRSRLLEMMQAQQVKDLALIKGEFKKTEWGSQIRSYVLHPYRLVKDLRTGLETGKVDDFLNGQIDEFIDAYLLWRVNAKA